MRLAGEPQTQVARELAYADPSGMHRAVTRLEAKARTDPKLSRRLEGLRTELSNVKS